MAVFGAMQLLEGCPRRAPCPDAPGFGERAVHAWPCARLLISAGSLCDPRIADGVRASNHERCPTRVAGPPVRRDPAFLAICLLPMDDDTGEYVTLVQFLGHRCARRRRSWTFLSLSATRKVPS